MKQSHLPEITERTALERVRFQDGMVVNADDLHLAMTYPVDVLRTLARAYFGCGIVCGLEVDVKGESGFTVEVKKGVALDCHGHPLELRRSVCLDLTPGECAKLPDRLCIAIGRVTTEESPRPASECLGEASDPAYNCTRVQEYVRIKVFAEDDLPGTICMYKESEATDVAQTGEDCNPGEGVSESTQTSPDPCSCLAPCRDEVCCDDAWVLLACVERNAEGFAQEGIDTSSRKYVTPIDCLCRPCYPMPGHWLEKVQTMIEDAVDSLAMTTASQHVDTAKSGGGK
jgi:hypothetical protein